jgi:predicted esterase
MQNFVSKHFTSKFIETQSFGLSNHSLMIVMHGLGDQLDSYVPLVKEINLTGINYLLINAPRNYPIGYSWYDLPPEDPRPSINESIERLKKLIDELLEHGYNYENIYLMGFSQGGAMAIELGNSLNQKLGGVLALSPRIYMDPTKLSDGLKKTPVFSAHGKYDEVIPFHETHAGLMQMKEQIGDFSFSEYLMGHEICFDEIVAVREWLTERV